jgi:DNA-binding NarL/FixJ family response regulator
MPQIIIVARYPTVRAGLASILAAEADISVIAVLDDVALLPAVLEEHLADALLIDVVDDNPDRLEALQTLADDGLLPPVVLLAGSPSDALDALGSLPNVSLLLRDASPNEIRTALWATKDGLVTLDPRIVTEVQEHLNWQPRSVPEALVEQVVLTPRERQVLQAIGRGLPNKAIAMELGISDHTVKFHVGSIFQKLNASSRSEAIAIAARSGLLAL